MTNQNQDESRRSAGDIAAYLKSREQARAAAVPRPAILNEQAPEDPARLPGWRALRTQAEEQYTAALLGKANLSPDEQVYLGSRIADHLRGA